MSNGLPERQAIIDLYDVELDTAHSQMCSTDYKECCQQSHDEFVKALDDLIRSCSRREEEIWSALAGRDQYAAGLDAARQAVEAELGWEEPDPSDDFKPHTAIWKFRALAAIDALREKQK